MKEIQENFVLAAGAEETVPTESDVAVPQDADPASEQRAPSELAGPEPLHLAPMQDSSPSAATKECPVDFKRFPSAMQYCPEHGTRLRDLRTDSASAS